MNYRKGDIFKTELMQLGVILVHGCNSRGKMGSGFAKSFAKKYPDAFKKYVEDLESKEIGLGGISWAAGPDGVYLASGITQLYYGRDVSHRYVSYDAIDKVMDVVFFAASKIDFGVHMPKIGCGLGGGDWDVVSAIILTNAKKHGVDTSNIFVWEL